ncbi:MAG TPA: hypothetical protein VIM71_14215 [Lacunisphaera sp.]
MCGFLALATCGQAATAVPDWLESLHLIATGGVNQVDNLSRTSYEPTRKDAITYEFSVSSALPRQLTRNLLLTASAEASSLSVPDYDLTDNVRFAGRLALQTKFGLGPQATVLKFSAGTSYKSARFAGDRGWTTEAGVQVSKRVLANVRLAANASLLEHDARSATFDLNQHSFSVDAQWDIDDHWTLSASAGRLGGDIVANAAWTVWAQAISGGFGPAVSTYYNARPWTVTHLYGPKWVSYNVEADVDLWSISLGYAFNARTSVEVRRTGAYVVNRIGIAYPTDSWGLSLTHRF